MPWCGLLAHLCDLQSTEALKPGVRFYHMIIKRVKPNIVSNPSRLTISICEVMSTDQGKWFHFLVYLSSVFLIVCVVS